MKSGPGRILAPAPGIFQRLIIAQGGVSGRNNNSPGARSKGVGRSNEQRQQRGHLPLLSGAWLQSRPAAGQISRAMSSSGRSNNQTPAPKPDSPRKGETLAEYAKFFAGVVDKSKRDGGGKQDGSPVEILDVALQRQGQKKVRYTYKLLGDDEAKMLKENGAEEADAEEDVEEEGGAAAGREGSWQCEAHVMGKVFSGVSSTKAKALMVANRAAMKGLIKTGMMSRVCLDTRSSKQRAKYSIDPGLTAPKDAKWRDTVPKKFTLRAIHEPREVPIPELAHDLHKILDRDNSVATSLQSHRVDGKHLDIEYLSKIEQPEAINWNSIPPFTPSSKDEHLHMIAKRVKAKFKASTSSISGLLGHIYQVMSNFRPVDTSMLSRAFDFQSKNFSGVILKKPVAVILRPKDGVVGIDSEPESGSNHQILIDLGKTLERMLTLNPDEFRRLVRKTPGQEDIEVPEDFNASTYNFSQVGDFCLRSQLDCVYGGNKIFDLKTRATHAIRNSFAYPVAEGKDPRDVYKPFVESYKIKQQNGLYNSFEREVYDMMRSAFLKYSLQLRIGRMHGAFVTYHNTAEIFGFQYLALSTIDKMIFGSPAMAETHFSNSATILSTILDNVLRNYPKDSTLRMSMLPLGNSRALVVESRPVVSESRKDPAPGTKDDPVYKFEFGEPSTWIVWVRTFINGVECQEPWFWKKEDKFEVKYCIVKSDECESLKGHNLSELLAYSYDKTNTKPPKWQRMAEQKRGEERRREREQKESGAIDQMAQDS